MGFPNKVCKIYSVYHTWVWFANWKQFITLIVIRLLLQGWSTKRSKIVMTCVLLDRDCIGDLAAYTPIPSEDLNASDLLASYKTWRPMQLLFFTCLYKVTWPQIWILQCLTLILTSNLIDINSIRLISLPGHLWGQARFSCLLTKTKKPIV